MSGFFRALSRAVVRHRVLVVAAWLVVAVIVSHGFPSLGSQVNNENSQFLPSNAPSNIAADLGTPLLGDTVHRSQVIVVVHRRAAITTASTAALIQREIAAIRLIPTVDHVTFLGQSANGETAQIFVDARVSESAIDKQKRLISELEQTFQRVDAPSGVSLYVAGPVADNVANQSKSNKAGSSVQGLSLLFIVLLLLIIFRALLAPLLTLAPAALALVISGRIIGELGAHGLQISQITQLLLIVLLLGAGTDYGLFLVFRVREEIWAGLEPREAVVHALERVGESISASAATVIFALLSLLLATFGIYHDLGIPLAIGVAVILLAGLTFLPALLAIFGRAVFWPSHPVAGAHRDGWWGEVASRLLRRPALTLALGVVFFGGLATASLSYRAGGFGGAVNAPSGSDAARGDAILARAFPVSGGDPTNLILRFEQPVFAIPALLDRGEQLLRASGEFTTIAGPLNAAGVTLSAATFQQLHARLGAAGLLPAEEPAALRASVPTALYNAYRATAAFVSRDGRTIQYEVGLTAGNAQSTAALNAMPKVRSTLTDVARTLGARQFGVAGVAAALADVSSTSNHDLLRIIPIAIIAIGILLGLVLRSAVAPLYLIVSVALSYLAALGVSVIVFLDIGGESGLTFVLPFLMFIFLLALGEDYNILVMTRIREEAHHHPLPEAVTRAVGRSGTTITSAGMILAGTFAVLALAGGSGPGGSQIKAIGFGLAIGVLLDTFLVRTVIVPAVVRLLGRANWWPGAMGRRTHGAPPA